MREAPNAMQTRCARSSANPLLWAWVAVVFFSCSFRTTTAVTLGLLVRQNSISLDRVPYNLSHSHPLLMHTYNKLRAANIASRKPIRHRGGRPHASPPSSPPSPFSASQTRLPSPPSACSSPPFASPALPPPARAETKVSNKPADVGNQPDQGSSFSGMGHRLQWSNCWRIVWSC